jgi:hypothetical protein
LDEPIANITLNGKKLKVFPAKSEMRQWCLLSPFLLNIVLKFLAILIRQEEEIKRIQIENEVMKLSLFAYDMIFYHKVLKKSTKKLIDITNNFRKVSGYKINLQKAVAFLFTNNE